MDVRKSIIETIDLLAHPSKQLEYERDVPIAQVPAELICMFCDDLYHPESELMLTEFTEQELIDLVPLYDALCEAGTLKINHTVELIAHPKWKTVVALAEQLSIYYQHNKE